MTADNRVWLNLPEPLPGHPDTTLLWEAEQALQSIGDLAEKPDIRNAFVKQLATSRSELEAASDLVLGTECSIAFVGDIGVGKTTALCRIAGLETSDGIMGKPSSVLEVGAGGTTICEVQIANGPDYGLRVEPRSESELRQEVGEFARLLIPSLDTDQGDEATVSKEVERAIRNMSGLQRIPQRNPDGSFAGSVDPARDLAEELGDVDALANEIWSKMALHQRTRRELWYAESTDVEPLAWLQENFRLLNYGRNPEFSLPQSVEVMLPQRILGEETLSIRIVDTKGIDDTAEREDLMVHLNAPNTIAVLCSGFNAAPGTSVQHILERSVEARYPDLETKSAILVLPRSGEALAVKDDLGDTAATTFEGYQYKREQAELSLSTARLPVVRVGFFDVYGDDAEQFNSFLMELIAGLREMHRARLEEVVTDALALVENFENEQARAVQKQAATHLTTWLNSNRQVGQPSGQPQDSLFRAIGVVNASSLRASVRRYGEWPNLDYPHQLSHGARVAAASAVVPQFEEFRAIVKNLLRNPELVEASGLLQQALRIIPSATESLLGASQRMGREVHTEYMRPDDLFWDRCVNEWGRGPGYKGRVARHNRDWFDADRHDIEARAEEIIRIEWQRFLSRIEDILPPDDDS